MSFGRQFDTERQEMQQTESSMQLLRCYNCNMHVLLGISSACEKVRRQAQKDSGKDQLAAFKSAQECSAIW